MEVLCEMYVITPRGLRAIMAAGGDLPPSSYDNERVASDLANTDSCHCSVTEASIITKLGMKYANQPKYGKRCTVMNFGNLSENVKVVMVDIKN